jgi:serine/threonine protein kinase/tetratricopeptide (TPR) repeat protein
MATRCPKCQAENPETSLFCAACGSLLGPEAAPPAPSGTPPSVAPAAPPAEPSPDFSHTRTLETPLGELKPGATFAGRYQIIEELGHGGMGRVYRAFDQTLDEEVALKLIRPEIALDKRTLERFHNELKLARKISHRNIGRMYELLEDRGRHFITMEFVPGQDLRGLIRQTGELTSAKAVSIAAQISDGLAEAHRLGIVHRDLKPSNIIIDRDGNARIMDFGIARSLGARAMTGEGIIVGTPEYMSPEQVEGKETDPRSDIYSLGIILYEMVAGRVPFEGDTPFTVGVKHKSETPKDPREFNPQLPDELSRLILRCLEKDKAKRYQSAEEVRTGLETIRQGLPTTTHAVPRRKPFTSREISVRFPVKKALWPALGVVAVAAVVFAFFHFLPRKSAAPALSPKPSLAILYFENISEDKGLDAWKTGLTELLITKLSQSKFMRVVDANTIFGILRRLNLTQAKKYSNDDLVKVAREGSAGYTLTGSLMKAGDRIILNLTLQKPQTSEVISPINIECRSEADIISGADTIADRIKADLNFSSEQIAGDLNKDAGKITTSSPEAFKYYSQARQYHLGLDYKNAITLYEKAVALDSGFAMAYRGLAAAWSNLGYRQKTKEYVGKAFELRDRVSERESYLITAQYYYVQSERTYDKALEALTKLLEIYPDDMIGNNYLSMVYSALEEWDKQLAQCEKIVRTRKDLLSYWNLASIYQIMGLYDKAGNAFTEYQKTVPDSAPIHYYLGQNYCYQRKYDLALQEADRAFLLEPDSSSVPTLRGDVALLAGRFGDAEKEYQKFLELADQRTRIFALAKVVILDIDEGKFGRAREQVERVMALTRDLGEESFQVVNLTYSGFIDLKTGRPKNALDSFTKGEALAAEQDLLPHERFLKCLEGIACVEAGLNAKAEQAAAELKGLLENSLNKKAWRYYDLLEGWIALGRKDFAGAVENLERAITLMPCQSQMPDEQAFFLAPLAEAYYRAGETAKAREQYERITALTVGRAGNGDIYAKSFYMLGKIAEQQGDRARARENYQKFLTLWKNADPGFPEPEDARKRLSDL